jgi:hypothetical protein
MYTGGMARNRHVRPVVHQDARSQFNRAPDYSGQLARVQRVFPNLNKIYIPPQPREPRRLINHRRTIRNLISNHSGK